MTFPVYIELFGIRIHPHFLFELLAYSIGFQVYLRLRKRQTQAFVPLEQNMMILVGCIFGALAGAKVLSWLETPQWYWAHWTEPLAWMHGKTIVGGFIGGWAGVELVKKWIGVTHSTGDKYVFPLIIGTCIGRIGCFLTGLEDDTYGTPTSLPWGIDFGDHIPRHPTQIYEILFLIALAMWLLWRCQKPFWNGYVFRVFMLSYFAFRFFVEMIKPHTFTYLGVTAIQIASFGAFLYCAVELWKKHLTAFQPQEIPAHE